MATGFLKRIFGAGGRFSPAAPDQPLFVIGDLHGRADLLDKLLDQTRDGEQIICVGDYVDRGENSADVLTRLHETPDILCLKGNHEDMLLGFLEDPENAGPRWLRYGGLQTLASFGVPGISERMRGGELTAARDEMVKRMGNAQVEWLQTRPLFYETGNVAIVHAGADPVCPIAQQSNTVLMWGHPEFRKTTRPDGIWVVHGHTIVDEPMVKDGRISVDTGAYATGRLTAARIGADGIEFVRA